MSARVVLALVLALVAIACVESACDAHRPRARVRQARELHRRHAGRPLAADRVVLRR